MHTLNKASLILLLISAACKPISNPRVAVSEPGMNAVAQPSAAALAYSHMHLEIPSSQADGQVFEYH